MNTPAPRSHSLTTRRDFLKHSSKVMAGAALAGALAPRPGYAAEHNTLKLALDEQDSW